MKRVNGRWITFAMVTVGVLGCAMSGSGQEAKPAAKPTSRPHVKPATRPTARPSEKTVEEAAKAGVDPVTNGVTLPFQQYPICFATTGVISQVFIHEGDVVEVGELLMVQDQDLDKADLALLKLDVNPYAIQAARAKEEAAAAEFKAKENLRKAGGGSDLEVEQARAEWEVAKIQIKAAEQELLQKQAKAGRQELHIEKMTLVAPVSGVVREITNHVGSNVDPTKQVLTLLENNTIKVRVQVPALPSLQLELGDQMWVSYDRGVDRKSWRSGVVTYMAPQADAASGMRLVVVEVPNPQKDPSGLRIFVEFPDVVLSAMVKAKVAEQQAATAANVK